jgi:hypothetical protein
MPYSWAMDLVFYSPGKMDLKFYGGKMDLKFYGFGGSRWKGITNALFMGYGSSVLLAGEQLGFEYSSLLPFFLFACTPTFLQAPSTICINSLGTHTRILHSCLYWVLHITLFLYIGEGSIHACNLRRLFFKRD